MTIRTTSRAAGSLYFLYLVAGMSSMAGFRMGTLPNVVMEFCALGLGVTLYALTRSVDNDLAVAGLACRLLEAGPASGEIYFAVGSTIFCWLLVKGRLIPAPLAWLGLVTSAALSARLFWQAAEADGGRTDWSSPFTWVIWGPVLIFELAFATWLLAKGVSGSPTRQIA